MSENIEDVFFKFLKSDTVLQGLLGASAYCSKIFPGIAPGTMRDANNVEVPLVAPHIVYIRMGEGSLDEILDNLRLTFKITTPDYDYSAAGVIRKRLKDLLNVQSNTLAIQAFSTDYFIDWCKQNGGEDSVDNETKEVVKILNFDIIFRNKN